MCVRMFIDVLFIDVHMKNGFDEEWGRKGGRAHVKVGKRPCITSVGGKEEKAKLKGKTGFGRG